jgi:hypothetical protein
MKKFMVTEIRSTEKGERFNVDTLYEAESKEQLRKLIDDHKPAWILDKKYKIKELKE